MRLFGLDIRRGRDMAASTAIQGKDSQYADLQGEAGWDPELDPNQELAGNLRWMNYNEMRLADPTVRSTLWYFKLPIKAGNWTVEPYSDDPDDVLIADAVAAQLGLDEDEGTFLDLSWRDVVGQQLLALDYGCYFEEIVWGDVTTWIDGEGNPRDIRPIVRLAPRPPSTVFRVERDNAGRIVEIEQDVPGAKPIPGEKLCHFAIEVEGGDWRGTSLLRPMYGPWRLKKGLMVSAAIGWDRYAAGTPKVRYPEGGGSAAERKAQAIGENVRLHERGYVVLEGPPPPQGGWDVEVMSGAGSLADPVPLLRHYDQQIVSAGMQQFSQLGTSERGSRAVGETLSDPFYLAVQQFAEWVAEERRRQVVRPFVDENFGSDRPTPDIRVSKIGHRDIEVLARAVALLSPLGFSLTDRDSQDDIRDLLGFSRLPDEELLPEEIGIEAPVAVPTGVVPGAPPPEEGEPIIPPG